jgi:RloB-like protein
MTRRSSSRGRQLRGGDLTRTPKEREELKIIYVVAEGEGTEYDYLNRIDRVYGRQLGFRIKTPNPVTQRNGLNPRRVVEEAVQVVVKPDIDQVWALFDPDGRSDVPQVCALARKRGVNAALSHPAFELWLLLHFPNRIPAAQDGRNKVLIDSLRRADLLADYARRDKRIDDRRFCALWAEDGIADAVKQSRALVDRCPSGCGCSARNGHAPSCEPAQRDPSTDVYLLIQSLGIVPLPQ